MFLRGFERDGARISGSAAPRQRRAVAAGRDTGAQAGTVAKSGLPNYCHSRESGNPDRMRKEHRYFVYILASKRNGTLYVGVTSNLAFRVGQHRDEIAVGFTKRYGIHMLVWFEEFSDIHDAIRCEKRIKKWRRAWKLELIEKFNPVWKDLLAEIA